MRKTKEEQISLKVFEILKHFLKIRDKLCTLLII